MATSGGIVSGGIAAIIPFNPRNANKHPPIQLAAAKMQLSTNNCLIKRERVASIEARIAISFSRTGARASRRFATLLQAMRSSMKTAATIAKRVALKRPTESSLKELTTIL
jgi:hypothetical protein